MIKIKITLVALNARFEHTNLGVRFLREYCRDLPVDIEILEFSINNGTEHVLYGIYESKPDIVGFSCYIWNIGQMTALSNAVAKLLPKALRLAGGPEISFEYEKYLHSGVFDMIATGEGEETLKALAALELSDIAKKRGFCRIPGIAYIDMDTGKLIKTGKETQNNLDMQPFPYTSIELKTFRSRIMYYEASRGCPFNCGYCLSGTNGGVRFRSLELVFGDLRRFLDEGARLVKFVDRTFNCNKKFANKIWRFLIDNDNGVTCFHFEIAADLINEEALQILRTARAGYFQFEAGIQSANKRVLELVSRECDLDKLASNIIEIKKQKNIHLHLDLIAGLPGEDIHSFGTSFNFAYSLGPHMLQLGFLKLLKGSAARINASSLGLIFRDDAPYEVLFTKELNFDDLNLLKTTAELVGMYHNSGMFAYSLPYLTGNGAWEFFIGFAAWYVKNNPERRAIGKHELFGLLARFVTDDELALNLLKFDLLISENIGSVPDWFPGKICEDERMQFRGLYVQLREAGEELGRICRIEKFSFDIINSIKCSGKSGEFEKYRSFVLFDYGASKRGIGGSRKYLDVTRYIL